MSIRIGAWIAEAVRLSTLDPEMMSRIMQEDFEQANAECEALVAAKPGLTISDVFTTMPTASPAFRTRFAELLGKAGLPA